MKKMFCLLLSVMLGLTGSAMVEGAAEDIVHKDVEIVNENGLTLRGYL